MTAAMELLESLRTLDKGLDRLILYRTMKEIKKTIQKHPDGYDLSIPKSVLTTVLLTCRACGIPIKLVCDEDPIAGCACCSVAMTNGYLESWEANR